MGGSFAASISHGSSNQQSGGQQGTYFPTQFLAPYSSVYGGGVTFDELLGGLPRSSGLFGGNQVGIFPRNPMASATAPQGPGVSPATGGYPPGAQGFGFGGGGAQPGGGISYGDVINYLSQSAPNPQTTRKVTQMFEQSAQALGFKPGQTLSIDQLGQIAKRAGLEGPYGTILSQLPAQAQQLLQLQGQQPRFGASGSQGGIDALAGYQSLGFGQLPPDARGGMPNIRDLPLLRAPQAFTAQANIAPQGFEQFGQDLYAQQFEPQRREIERQGSLQDRQLQDQLANAGLASSGSGVGLQQRQVQERNRQLQAASSDAANNASVQRFGLQYQQELQNAQMRQQTALANAGFDLQAQQQNADNVLRGDLARADNYLKAYGLTQDAATQARNSFLQALGLQESDLARQDAFQQQTLGLLLNDWLQTFGAVAQAGQTSRQYGAGSSKQFGLSQSSSGGLNG